jgi:para-nitrobenzyl esterase
MKPAALWLMAENNRIYPGIFVPGPVQDDLIPEYPWEAMAKGSAEGVDVIFGTNHDEGTLFIMILAGVVLKKLGIQMTCEPKYETKKLYHS